MRRLFALLTLLLIPTLASAQIDCSSGFSTSGACGLSNNGNSQAFWSNFGQLSGTSAVLLPQGQTHANGMMWYQTQENIQAFNTTFTFVPNGQNVAFAIQNTNNNPMFNGSTFAGGAGCEAGFFQGFSQTNPPNNVFALELDSYSPLTQTGGFTFSSAQIYTSNPFVECPCMPDNQCGTNNTPLDIPKISTSPVNLTTGSQNTTTGDTYSANLVYDGNNLTLNLQDITLGGPVFVNTWTGVNIPASVGGNTAWVGFSSASGLTSGSALTVDSFTFSGGTPSPTPTPISTATPTATPTVTPTPTDTPTPTATATSTVTPTITATPKPTCRPGSVGCGTPTPTPTPTPHPSSTPNPVTGAFYQNFQCPVETSGTPGIVVPPSGQYIAGTLAVPTSGDRRLMVLSDFTVSVQNNTTSTIDVNAQIGVSNPSQTTFPMAPYVGVLHSIARAQILPGQMASLAATRMDVIDPGLFATNIPWAMALGADGANFPMLAPEVFAPAGVRLDNCAARAWING